MTWEALIDDALQTGTLIQLVLSRPWSAQNVLKISVRPVEIGGQIVYQWTTRRGSQEFHENLSASDLSTRLSQQAGTLFGDLHGFTAATDFTVRWTDPRGGVKLKRQPPSRTAAELTHNRERQYLLPDGVPCPFLIALGVMAPNGRVHPTKYHKFRQINRYLELIQDVLPHLPGDGPIRVVDFGSGKSSLTFALHHFLSVQHGRSVDIVGLDRKTEVLAECQQLAERLECQGLRFRAGEIATYEPLGPVHLAISLHACDTATDDALAAAPRWQSDVILAVPCCQHELQRLLPESTLPGLTGYGLLKERFAAMATDALRARYLDAKGYRTQVVEFIELEHTPKNVLLRAIRRNESDHENLANRAADYLSFKSELGLTTWHLEQIAGEIRPGG